MSLDDLLDQEDPISAEEKELRDAFSQVFKNQPIEGVTKKRNIIVILVKPDPAGGNTSSKNSVDKKIPKGICAEADDKVVIDWKHVESSIQWETAMALIYGDRTTNSDGTITFTHHSENLFNGWLNVLRWGKISKNVKPIDSRTLLSAR